VFQAGKLFIEPTIPFQQGTPVDESAHAYVVSLEETRAVEGLEQNPLSGGKMRLGDHGPVCARDIGTRTKQGDSGFQKPAVPKIVTIEVGDQGTFCEAMGVVAGGALPRVWLCRVTDARIGQRRDDFAGAIRAAIIDNKQFPIREILLLN